MLENWAWIWALAGIDRRKKREAVAIERRRHMRFSTAAKRLNESIERFNETVTKKYEAKQK